MKRREGVKKRRTEGGREGGRTKEVCICTQRYRQGRGEKCTWVLRVSRDKRERACFTGDSVG